MGEEKNKGIVPDKGVGKKVTGHMPVKIS